MNIQIQCCGLAILLVLKVVDKIEKKARLYSERIFRQLFNMAIISLTLDILSLVAIFYHEQIPSMLVVFACKIYLVALLFVIYSCLLYTAYDIKTLPEFQRFRKLVLGYCILGSVLVMVFPLYYYIEGKESYSYGLSVGTAYAFAAPQIMYNLFLTIYERKKMNVQRRKAIQVWMFIWITACGIQFFNNQLLVVGFATAIGVIIVYAVLENPVVGHDRATGVFNTTMLKTYMQEKCVRGERFSALYLFLGNRDDHISEIYQDDRLVFSIAEFLRSFKRAKVFRNLSIGFTIIFDEEEDMRVAYEKIWKQFLKPWEYGKDSSVRITPSYCILSDSMIAKDADEIYALLNYNLTERKFYDEMVTYIDNELVHKFRRFEEVKAEIRSAIREDRVVMYYQPIYSTKKKQFVSAEALVRINDRDGNVVSPVEFIPVAEKTGQIWELGIVIFKKCCEFLQRNDIRSMGLGYIEVNLSVIQCEQQELSKLFKNIMEEYGISPTLINLEITESSGISVRQNVFRNMMELTNFGVDFSLDDFGSGHSNLDYIIDMSVSIVKFDRDLTQAYFNNERAHFVLSSIAEMIKRMNLRIVAEGVESKEQLDELTKLGVDFIQGYYFSKPLPEDKFIQYISANYPSVSTVFSEE